MLLKLPSRPKMLNVPLAGMMIKCFGPSGVLHTAEMKGRYWGLEGDVGFGRRLGSGKRRFLGRGDVQVDSTVYTTNQEKKQEGGGGRARTHARVNTQACSTYHRERVMPFLLLLSRRRNVPGFVLASRCSASDREMSP